MMIMQRMLFDIFGSLKIIELMELKKGIRNHARWVIPYRESKRYERILSILGVLYEKSDFSLKAIRGNDSHFHEYMRSSNAITNDSHIALYLSSNNPISAKIAEGDHSAMGRLLGYPSCCIKAFMEHHSIGAHRIIGESSIGMHEKIYLRSELVAHPYYMNLLRREHGMAMLSHIPCSLDCEHSNAIASLRGRMLERHDFEMHHALRQDLVGEHKVRGKAILFY
jgi:hypothetical protein